VTGPLAGRIALVTGGGRGSGAAIAHGLAQAGARVIMTDIDRQTAHETAEAIVRTGGDARGFALDVTDEVGCGKLAEDLALLVGPIRILVNNAGIFLRGSLTAAESRERWSGPWR
jgi:NAD(P)-dependent dehydrogenase (short-subunit alcohol dehydrogenase family)